ncbi:MAG: amidohydrolase family protein, partial [Gemmatimonadota bacterium]|nr:amidohydrolase family protein [Gemmatimonadota bacterium]
EATHRAFEAAEASGMRVVMGKVLMDRNAPEPLLEPVDEAIADSLALAERWEGAGGGRLGYAITPRFALSCSAEMLAAAGRAAVDADLKVQTHLAEQPEEVAAVADRFPDAADYLEVYERAGLVKPGAVFAHAVHCSDDAYRRLAAGGGAIACCPTSNAFLGSGAFPLARARAAGVTIGVGSDVGAGPQFSPLDVLRHLAHLDRLAGEELLYRGTAAGAEALGLDELTGRIEPGLGADLVVLEPPDDATGSPLERFVQSVFRQPETRVAATLVDGRPIHGSLPGEASG